MGENVKRIFFKEIKIKKMTQINISKCSIEDQYNLVLKIFGAYFITDKRYEIFANRVQLEFILSPEGWEYLLEAFENWKS